MFLIQKAFFAFFIFFLMQKIKLQARDLIGVSY